MARAKHTLTVEFEKELDGRWIAEIRKVPGALAYGKTKSEARAKATAIALRALADRVEQQKPTPVIGKMFVSA